MRRRYLLGLLLAPLLLGVRAWAPAAAHAGVPADGDSLLILVATGSPVTRLDRDLVRDLFLGRITTLHAIPEPANDRGDDARIRLFLAAEAEEPFTRTFLDLSARRFRKRWVKSLLSGEATHGPETVAGTAQVAAAVARDRGAFGVCRAGALPDGVRVVEVGRAPGAAAEGR